MKKRDTKITVQSWLLACATADLYRFFQIGFFSCAPRSETPTHTALADLSSPSIVIHLMDDSPFKGCTETGSTLMLYTSRSTYPHRSHLIQSFGVQCSVDFSTSKALIFVFFAVVVHWGTILHMLLTNIEWLGGSQSFSPPLRHLGINCTPLQAATGPRWKDCVKLAGESWVSPRPDRAGTGWNTTCLW